MKIPPKFCTNSEKRREKEEDWRQQAEAPISEGRWLKTRREVGVCSSRENKERRGLGVAAGYIGRRRMVEDSMVNIQLEESSTEAVGMSTTQLGLQVVVVMKDMGMGNRYQKWRFPGN